MHCVELMFLMTFSSVGRELSGSHAWSGQEQRSEVFPGTTAGDAHVGVAVFVSMRSQCFLMPDHVGLARVAPVQLL